MNILTMDNGKSFDLDTKRGAYEYVGHMLGTYGASSIVFSALGKLCPKDDEGEPTPKVNEL